MPAASGIDARFDVIERVGAGAWGDVFRATDRETGAVVAVKRLRAHVDDAVAVERFHREARLLARVTSDHVVRYVDSGVDARGAPCLVVEWLVGEDLGRRQRRTPLAGAEILQARRSSSRPRRAAGVATSPPRRSACASRPSARSRSTTSPWCSRTKAASRRGETSRRAPSRRFVRQGDPRLEAASRVYLARIHLLLGDVAGAEREARAVIATGVAATSPIGAQAVLARALLAGRDGAAEALAAARTANEVLATTPVEEWEWESLARVTLVEALTAAGDGEAARGVLLEALERLASRVASLRDPRLRSSVVTRIPEHARMLAAARSAGIPAPAALRDAGP